MSKLNTLTVTVALSSDEATIVKIEEKLPVEGTLEELSGIFHQVHELMERIRDEQAGLQPARRVRGVGVPFVKPERGGG